MSLNLYSCHAVLGMAISEQKTAPLRIHMQYSIYVVQLWNQFRVFVNNEPTQYDFIKIDLFFSGLKCKECKYRCHRDCESHVPPSCGLPEDLLRHYINQLTKEGSPILPARLPVASNDPSFLASIRGPAGNCYF